MARRSRKPCTGIGCIGIIIATSSIIALAGCSTTPVDPYVPPGERGVTTVGFDAHDYQLAASRLTQKMLKHDPPLPKGYVVTLGPVNTQGTPYSVDVDTLQDKIEAILDEEGTLKFTVLKKAMTESGVAYDEMLKIIDYNWDNGHPVDREAFEKFGKQARISGMLFGRVSSKERDIPGGGREITYTLVWRLANTETGVNDMTLEDENRKNVRSSSTKPDWIANRKADDSLYTYCLREATGSTRQDAEDNAFRDALADISTRLHHRSIDINGAEKVPGSVYTEQSGFKWRCWLQVSYPFREKQDMLKRIERGDYLNRSWADANTMFTRGNYAGAANALKNILEHSGNHIGLSVDSEEAQLLLAECLEKENQCRNARDAYDHLAGTAANPDVRKRAADNLKRLLSDWAKYIMTEEFRTKKGAVLAAYSLSGAASNWPKLAQDAEAYLQGFGARIQPLEARAEDVVRIASSPAAAADLIRLHRLDFLLVFAADGRMHTQANAQNPSGEDCRFDGNCQTALVADGKTPYSEHNPAMTGWNPLGPDMCMGILALKMLDTWKARFFKSLGCGATGSGEHE